MIRQQGMALFQVLVVSAILAVLTMSFSNKAEQQLAYAQQVLSRSEGLLKMESVQSLVELRILTDITKGLPDNQWNLYARSFSYEGIDIQVQDLSGLYYVPSSGAETLTSLFTGVGFSDDQASSLTARLNHWQKPIEDRRKSYDIRHGPLQTLGELKQVFDKNIAKKIQPFVTLYPTPYFNPLNAPDELLKAFLGNTSTAQTVVNLRQQNKLDVPMFWQLTGLDATDTIVFASGPGYRINMTYNAGDIAMQKRYEATFRPHSVEPLIYWQRSRIYIDPESNAR